MSIYFVKQEEKATGYGGQAFGDTGLPLRVRGGWLRAKNWKLTDYCSVLEGCGRIRGS
jgi:hypothetical protein